MTLEDSDQESDNDSNINESATSDARPKLPKAVTRFLSHYSHHWKNVLTGGSKDLRGLILVVRGFPNSLALHNEAIECLSQALFVYREKVDIRFDDEFPGTLNILDDYFTN